jgi:hypothetical protein
MDEQDKKEEINTNEEYESVDTLDELEDAKGDPVEPLYDDPTNVDDTVNNEGEEDSRFQSDDAKEELKRGIEGGAGLPDEE